MNKLILLLCLLLPVTAVADVQMIDGQAYWDKEGRAYVKPITLEENGFVDEGDVIMEAHYIKAGKWILWTDNAEWEVGHKGTDYYTTLLHEVYKVDYIRSEK